MALVYETIVVFKDGDDFEVAEVKREDGEFFEEEDLQRKIYTFCDDNPQATARDIMGYLGSWGYEVWLLNHMVVEMDDYRSKE